MGFLSRHRVRQVQEPWKGIVTAALITLVAVSDAPYSDAQNNRAQPRLRQQMSVEKLGPPTSSSSSSSLSSSSQQPQQQQQASANHAQRRIFRVDELVDDNTNNNLETKQRVAVVESTVEEEEEALQENTAFWDRLLDPTLADMSFSMAPQP